MINTIDLDLKLLNGKGIEVKSGEDVKEDIEVKKICTIYPLKLSEIVDIGWIKYNIYLNLLCLEPDEIKKQYNINYDISTFEFLVGNYKFSSDKIKKIIIEAFKCFLKEPVYFYEAGFFI